MRKTSEKKCPKCKSENIRDTGDRVSDVNTVNPAEARPVAQYYIYECKDCYERFTLD